MTKELQTTTLLYSEYVVCTKYPSKYFIVNSLQQYVFVHTRSRVAAEEWRKTNYPLYSLRTTKEESGGGTGCSDTSSTRKGQAKYLNKSFGVPKGLR